MSNYVESKKKLDRIRSEYGCKGDMIFRTALQYIVEFGQRMFSDDEWVQGQLSQVDAKHDKAESESKILFIGREFEKAIIECSVALADINAYDLLIYIQKEVWLSNEGGIDYQTAVKLLKSCIYDIEERENCEDKLLLQALENIGFDDDDIETLGFGYVFDVREDEEDD